MRPPIRQTSSFFKVVGAADPVVERIARIAFERFRAAILADEWAHTDGGGIAVFLQALSESKALTSEEIAPRSAWARCVFEKAASLCQVLSHHGRQLLSLDAEGMTIDHLTRTVSNLRGIACTFGGTLVEASSAEGQGIRFDEAFHAGLSRHQLAILKHRNMQLMMSRLEEHVGKLHAEWNDVVKQGSGETQKSEEMFRSLISIANSLGDKRLNLQLQVLHELAALARECDLLRSAWSAAETRDKKQLSESWVGKLAPIRTLLHSIKGQFSRTDGYLQAVFAKVDVEAKGVELTELLHLRILDGAVDAQSIAQKLCDQTATVMEGVHEHWRQDLGMLTEKVSTWCPAWQARAGSEAALFERDFVKTMLTNKFYSQVTPVCNSPPPSSAPCVMRRSSESFLGVDAPRE